MPTLHIATRLSFTQFSETYREFIAFGKSASELRKRLYMLIEYGRILEKMLSSGLLTFAQLDAVQATMNSTAQPIAGSDSALAAALGPNDSILAAAPISTVSVEQEDGPKDYGIPVHFFGA